MALKGSVAAAVVAVIIGCILTYSWRQYGLQSPQEAVECDPQSLRHYHPLARAKGTARPECFFSESYYEARERFITLAKLSGATLRQLPVVDDLTTDVAILPGREGEFLVHISGTHGPESFAGSAVQLLALQYLHDHGLTPAAAAANAEEDSVSAVLPTIVFIHALNPFGFANNRRVNEDNIDLNRNFLLPEQFEAVKARDPNYAGYVDIDFLVNPTNQPFPKVWMNDLYQVGATLYALCRHGMLAIKRGLVAGNYFKQQGLGFGGFQLAKSSRNLIALAEELQLRSKVNKLVIIDVHTGMGPSGVDTNLINSAGMSEAAVEKLQKSFPTEYSGQQVIGGILETNFRSANKSQTSTSSGYDLTVGILTEEFCRSWLGVQNSESSLCLGQEFGTISPLLVGVNLVQENYGFYHGNAEEKAVYGQRLRDSFFVNTTAWKTNVARRGLALFLQSLEFMDSSESSE